MVASSDSCLKQPHLEAREKTVWANPEEILFKWIERREKGKTGFQSLGGSLSRIPERD